MIKVSQLLKTVPTADGDLDILRGINLEIAEGTSAAIVGASGSGKSTLLGLLAGMDVASGGEITLDGHRLSQLDEDQRARLRAEKIGFVFQSFQLLPALTARENVMLPLELSGKKQADDIADRLLEQVGLSDRLDHYPTTLSGGEQQRVAIARAFARQPKILFADEPTTALDVTVQAQILDLIAEQRAERNMSVVLVTHDLGVVAGHTDVIAVMYGGRLVEVAPTAVLFSDMRMPYTEALLQSIPRLDQPSHTRLNAIPGRPPELLDPPPGCAFAPRCAFARDRCREEAPPLTETDNPEHRFACWYPVGSPEHSEAKERIAAGLQIGSSS